MRFRKVMVVVLVAGLTLTGTSAVALGADGEAAGRGWVACRGRGLTQLDMGGKLRLQIKGSVTIRDIAGDATIYINDRADDDRISATEIILEDLEGGIKVTGSHFVVVARGGMRFVAAGHGFANLEGVGVCKHGLNRPWHRWNGRVEI